MGQWEMMLRALELASGQQTHPNPRVGSVIVGGDGQIHGEGFHVGPGEPHAEIVALERAGSLASGATIYVSLEPCTFTGRTPPCVDALVAAGISHVRVGAVDPDPRVSGSGIAALRSAGIEVDIWEDEMTAEAVDQAYFHHRRTGLPYVTLKYAMTLDGSVAALDGSSQWISGTEARDDAHELRARADAVVVGAGTLRRDDPLLNVRLSNFTGRQPRPVIVAGSEPLPEDRRIWERQPIVVSVADRPLPDGELLLVEGTGDLPDPLATARSLADLGYIELLLEGGPGLASSWWDAGLVSRGVAYLGAKVGGGSGYQPIGGEFGSISAAAEVDVTDVRILGSDVRIEFR